MAKKRKYVVKNDTYYSEGTSPDMVNILERLRNEKKRVTFRFGDPKTGKDWGEDNDITGRIGRSTGQIKIPLLIHNRRSMGGGGLLSANIVKIIESKESEQSIRILSITWTKNWKKK